MFTMEKNKVAVILDDEKLFADSFSLLLEKYQLFEQIHVFNNPEDLIRFLIVDDQKEIFFFLDYFIKEHNGVGILQDIKKFGRRPFIIFVSSTTSPYILNNMLHARPHAIISKSGGIENLVACISSVKRNSVYIELSLQSLLDELKENMPAFSQREIQLLHLFSNGLSIAETAEMVYLSKHTIITYRRKMMAKANCHSIGQLLKIAKDNGVIR